MYSLSASAILSSLAVILCPCLDPLGAARPPQAATSSSSVNSFSLDMSLSSTKVASRFSSSSILPPIRVPDLTKLEYNLFFISFCAFFLIFLVDSSDLSLLKSTLTSPSLSSTLMLLAALLNTWSHQWNSNSSALLCPVPAWSNFSLGLIASTIPWPWRPSPSPHDQPLPSMWLRAKSVPTKDMVQFSCRSESSNYKLG